LKFSPVIFFHKTKQVTVAYFCSIAHTIFFHANFNPDIQSKNKFQLFNEFPSKHFRNSFTALPDHSRLNSNHFAGYQTTCGARSCRNTSSTACTIVAQFIVLISVWSQFISGISGFFAHLFRSSSTRLNRLYVLRGPCRRFWTFFSSTSPRDIINDYQI
jgi:hypothetical protein